MTKCLSFAIITLLKQKMTEQATIDPSQLQGNTIQQMEHLSFRPVVDLEGFKRSLYTVTSPDGPVFSIMFRGREELPIVEGDENATQVVVASDVRPIHTGVDRYGKWQKALTGDSEERGVVMEPTTSENVDAQIGRIWSMAAQEGSEEISLQVPGTAEGVLDAAVVLAKNGIGSEETVGTLMSLRSRLSDGRHDEETVELLDKILIAASGSVDSISREDGLILLVLSLGGDQKATELLGEIDKQFQINYRAVNLGRMAYFSYEEGKMIHPDKVAEPGEQIDESVLEQIKEAGLVGVHTTETNPLLGGIIRPTSEFNQGRPDNMPRDSIHFSLNHTVESHEGGDFRGRPFTVIAPLEGLVKINGAPSAMADVDTSFVTGPGEGLVLPKDTIVVEVGSSSASSETIVQPDGRWLINPQSLRSPEGIAVLARELGSIREEESGYASSDPLYYLSGLINDSDSLDLRFLRDNAVRRADETDIMWKGKTDEEKQLLRQNVADLQGVIDVLTSNGTVPFTNRDGHLDKSAYPRLLAKVLANQELLKNNKTFRGLLTESLRIVAVNSAVRKHGGRVVKGGMHYTQSPGFEAKTNAIAEAMGVTTALHANTPDSMYEATYGEAIARAIKYIDSEIDGRQRADFDWTKLDTDRLWSVLKTLPHQRRARAVAMGILTFGEKPRPVLEDEWGIG